MTAAAPLLDGRDQPIAPPDRSALVVERPEGSVVERVGCFGHDDGELAIALDVAVFARPTVAILSTGNEIVDPGRNLAPGQIYDINKFTLSTIVAEPANPSRVRAIRERYCRRFRACPPPQVR